MRDFATDSSELIRGVFEACAEQNKEQARMLILREIATSRRIEGAEDIEEFFLSVQEEIESIRTRLRDRGWESQLCDPEDFGPDANLRSDGVAQAMSLLLLWNVARPLPLAMRGMDFDEGIQAIGNLLTQCVRQFRWAEALVRRLKKRMR